jgi:hypothetical protein
MSASQNTHHASAGWLQVAEVMAKSEVLMTAKPAVDAR